MATAATILLGSTTDLLGRSCHFSALAIATMTLDSGTRWTVTGLSGDFLEIDGSQSYGMGSAGKVLTHGVLALIASNDQTYPATSGALRAGYASQGYRPSTNADAVPLEVVAGQVPSSWMLVVSVLPGFSIDPDEIVAVARAGICVVLTSLHQLDAA